VQVVDVWLEMLAAWSLSHFQLGRWLLVPLSNISYRPIGMAGNMWSEWGSSLQCIVDVEGSQTVAMLYIYV
jgi:hypothetical protein